MRKKSESLKTSSRRKLAGFSLMETMISLLILSSLIVVMANLTGASINVQSTLDAQYSILAADAYLSDIYQDFHASSRFTVTKNDGTGAVSLAFDLGKEGAAIYEYSPETGACLRNGMTECACKKFVVTGGADSLFVSMKLQDERNLEIDIYR